MSDIDDNTEIDLDYYRADSGGMVTNHNGVADKLLQNNKLYNEMKGDWKRTTFDGNMRVTTGREGGSFYIQREQMNVKETAERCRRYRQSAEKGIPDPLAPVMPDGKLGYRWMELPEVISHNISNDYFGGMPWQAIKHDKTLKAQFYSVVQKEYPAFICYPGGKLPIPIDVPYPTKKGTSKFFKGI